MASTASGRRRVDDARAAPASAVNPPKATARAGMLRLSVGNGCTRVMRPQSVVLVAHELAVPPRLDGVVLVPRQRRDDVEPVAAARPARRRCSS